MSSSSKGTRSKTGLDKGLTPATNRPKTNASANNTPTTSLKSGVLPPSMCSKCASGIEDDSDTFDCDGCLGKYHIQCDGVRKGDVTARMSSVNLRLFCSMCCRKRLDILNSEKLSIIYKYVEKIDKKTQEHVEKQADAVDKLASVISATKKLNDKIDDVKLTGDSQHKSNEKKSYASVLNNSNKPSVMIKPKNCNQNSTKTCDEIKSQINRKEVNACGIRKLYGGGMVVTCENNNSAMKMKQIVEEKFGEKYEVNLPQTMKPRIKILNVDDIQENEIVVELKERNEWLPESADIVLKKIIEKKTVDQKVVDVILEVDNECFENMMDAGRVNLGWKSCKVLHHVHITQCYNCCGFGHIAKNCKNKLACSKCGGEHKISECEKEEVKCVNCHMLNQKYKMKLDTNHRPWSKLCETYKKRIERFSRNFNIQQRQ